MIDQRLTKHLYRVDEACASFRKAIRGARYNDALAWVTELFASGCLGEVNVVLFEMWIFLVGCEDIGWLKRWYSCDQSLVAIQKATVSLIYAINERKHVDLITSLIKGSTPTPEPKTTPVAPRFVKILKNLEKSSSYSYKPAVQACINLAQSKGVKVRPYKDIDLGKFEVTPVETLKVSHLNIYGLSERGRMKISENTLWEVRGDIVETLLQKGTPYWQEALKGYDPEDPDCMEAFAVKHFPNDIPDEWSLAKQERTHGKGSLFESEEGASLVKFCRGFFAGTSLDINIIPHKKITGSTLFECFC
uniref:Uncharacterized protein n=1 Tax=viral metagenome TaxID=1070528 RepID=A0A6C0I9P1_9ZZZZ